MINSALKDIMDAINARNNGTEAYDTQAEVVRIEGRTAWVHIPGGVDETPVELTIAAKRGDTVQVRVANGQAWLTGNGSAPPTDDTTANTAKNTADSADKKAKAASETAEEAKEAVDGVVQHFWHDANGAHVKADGSNYQNNLTANGMAVVDTATGEVVAIFGTETRVGAEDEYNLSVDGNSLRIKDPDGNSRFILISGETTIGQLVESNTTLYGNAADGLQTIAFITDENTSTGFVLSRIVIDAGLQSGTVENEGAVQISGQDSNGVFTAVDISSPENTQGDPPVRFYSNSSSDSIASDLVTIETDGNIKMRLNTAATSGTDAALYAAITAIGWSSEVIS